MDLNPRPDAYKTSALPTELRQRLELKPRLELGTCALRVRHSAFELLQHIAPPKRGMRYYQALEVFAMQDRRQDSVMP